MKMCKKNKEPFVQDPAKPRNSHSSLATFNANIIMFLMIGHDHYLEDVESKAD